MSSSSTTTTATTTTVTSGGTTGIMSSGSGATPPAGTLPPVDISADRFAQLMAAITGTQVRLDDKLAEFKVEIAESQERAATSAARKVQANKESYVFKKKSHEEQHKANVNIDEALHEAEIGLEAAISSDPAATSAVNRAKDALLRGRKLLADRQKLIKIADRSDLGWAVVSEYTADELAADSDDEKRLEKAEKAAERKASKRKKNSESRQRPYKRPANPRLVSDVLQGQSVLPFPAASSGAQFRRQLMPSRTMTQLQREPGPCFACGQMGHYRSHCPKLNQSNSKSWYPQKCCENVVYCVDEASIDCDSGVCDVLELDPVWEEDSDYLSVTEVAIQETARGLCVKGRLKENVSFWKSELAAPDAVVSIIETGYVLPLKSLPPPCVRRNQLSAKLHADFVQTSINELVTTGCVRHVENVPHVCSPLSVVENAVGKRRLVLNLRYLNQHLWKQKFKYEDLRTAMMYFNPGDYLFAFDLKSGYHHVDIAEVHHKFLGFEWNGRYYVFTVLPFGLSSACYIFTKLVRPLVRYWRARGIKITVYLDDGLGVASNEQQALEASQLVRDTLTKAGFVAHPEKSQWIPTQRLVWLGFVIDMAVGQIEVPEDKLLATKELAAKILSIPQIPARLLARLVGKIISLGLAIGPVSRFMTRSLYALLESRAAWCDHLILSTEARTELEFWDNCLARYKAQPIWRAPSAVRVVYSDASETGYGGYTVEHGPHIAHGQWSITEMQQSSTWRELAAVLRVLGAIVGKLSNMRVRWFTDNQNVAHILKVGSKQQHLQTMALEVFFLTIQNHIHLEPEWIPRELNTQADYLSRIIDYDDWQLNHRVFSDLDRLWGPHTVDRFASNDNTQIERFNSRCWCPGTEAVDAFTVHWAGENNWLCPPITLVARVIRHAQVCQAEGTLIVPAWPSASFWPLLCPEGQCFASFVLQALELPSMHQLFVPCRSGAVLFGGGIPNTAVYALRCKF